MKRLLEPFLEAYPRWRARPWLLALFLVLSPVAYWLGREFQLKTAAESKYEIEGYRETLTRAHAAARSLMIDTRDWKHMIRFGTNDGMTRYEYWQGSRLPDAVRRVLPVAMINVLLYSPDRAKWVAFTFNQHGTLMHYHPSPGLFAATLQERAIDGRAIAQVALQTVLDPEAFTLGEAASQTTNAGRADRFEWNAKANCCRDLEISAAAEVEGRKPSYLRVATWFTAGYLRRLSTPLDLLAAALRWAFLLGAGLFVSLRFAQRAMEREVPLWRAAVILGGIVTVGLVQFALKPEGEFIISNENPGLLLGSLRYVIWFLSLLLPTVIGILMGLAYGATEGDIRERFEGKLTSLDALLSGAVASRNVGVAVLAGAACGAWAHGIAQVARRLVAPGLIPMPGSELRYSYTPVPWAGLLSVSLLDAVIVAIAVLPVPLAIGIWARGSGGSVWRGRILTILATAGALLIQDPLADAASMVIALAALMTLWLGFGGFDVLAALVALVVTRFGASLVDLMAVMPAWVDSAPMARSVAFATLAAAGYAVLRGRRYEDADVRPSYAQNIEERHLRQAEVAAAREAQLRLLPDKPPVVPGLGVAAFCAPAQGVSGDFFDFFPMPRGRLGVFVADGRAGGLSAALTIALAKGFLQYAAHRDWSCGEALSRLREVMAQGGGVGAASPGGELNLAFAVLDPGERRLQFARLGATPVLLAGLDSLDEARVLSGPAAGGLTEGQASFAAGDVLLIYTDGVPQRLADKQRERLEDWLRSKLKLTTGVTAYRIGEALQESLRAHEGNAPDDLTAVVIRFEQAQALEVVA